MSGYAYVKTFIMVAILSNNIAKIDHNVRLIYAKDTILEFIPMTCSIKNSMEHFQIMTNYKHVTNIQNGQHFNRK